MKITELNNVLYENWKDWLSLIADFSSFSLIKKDNQSLVSLNSKSRRFKHFHSSSSSSSPSVLSWSTIKAGLSIIFVPCLHLCIIFIVWILVDGDDEQRANENFYIFSPVKYRELFTSIHRYEQILVFAIFQKLKITTRQVNIAFRVFQPMGMADCTVCWNHKYQTIITALTREYGSNLKVWKVPKNKVHLKVKFINPGVLV